MDVEEGSVAWRRKRVGEEHQGHGQADAARKESPVRHRRHSEAATDSVLLQPQIHFTSPTTLRQAITSHYFRLIKIRAYGLLPSIYHRP